MTTRKRFGIVALVLLITAAVLGFAERDPRLKLGSREVFTKGHYLAFAQPWGGAQDKWFSHWAPHADHLYVDPARFPNNSGMNWSWPPKAPTAGGPWGYDFIAYGNYDDSQTEVPVPARRVRDIATLTQAFDWSHATRMGDANLLTEFYLRSDPADPESKVLEIGWFLHTPKATIDFIETGRQIGVWQDGNGVRWQVSLNEEYCTFVPVDRQDIPKGSIDMLAAIRWLQDKGLVKGDEWFTGLAVGIEPLKGGGRAQIDHWSVVYR